jgi:low temperature requirement protein LtrA
VGEPAQTWIWLAAFGWDFVFTYATSRGGGGWRLYSAGHWAERYGLIVILALGESIVAIGVGVAEEPIDGPIVLGTALAVTLSLLLWRAYFGRLSAAGEHELERRIDAARVIFARDAYTYLHFFIVMGVILTALGVEEAMGHIGDAEAFGWFGASALGSGVAVYLAATALFGRLAEQRWPIARLLAAALAAAGIALLAAMAPLLGLAGMVALLTGTLAVERAVRAERATASSSS